jgi:hypothetical protein
MECAPGDEPCQSVIEFSCQWWSVVGCSCRWSVAGGRLSVVSRRLSVVVAGEKPLSGLCYKQALILSDKQAAVILSTKQTPVILSKDFSLSRRTPIPGKHSHSPSRASAPGSRPVIWTLTWVDETLRVTESKPKPFPSPNATIRG